MGVVFVLVVGAFVWLMLGSGASFSAIQTVPAQLLTRTNLSPQERSGAVLYGANCYSCHGGPIGGAPIAHVPVHTAIGHTWHHADCQIKAYVLEGGDPPVSPDTPQMPAFRGKLSGQQLDQILAYIKTMWTVEEIESQGDFTRVACS